MKHEKIINSVFSLLRESWMTDEEHNEMIAKVLQEIGETPLSLSIKIEEGVRNGYSAEDQLAIINYFYK